ncbi:hypothetical protein DND132_2726 [Pseudodesulfovibrio mercurii]|uniref:Uncharacterized protein n=1 Tax=Pseudodesulfovibrio mercurii TaxID=641491 RepID=F0JJ30_9BACT|nr:hypothetical protein [Pseudodesulfovibrio mercurii]EGB15929.1 hypothetical protein DND132_2726 [Pseudodesulfovibrio mercurii]
MVCKTRGLCALLACLLGLGLLLIPALASAYGGGGDVGGPPSSSTNIEPWTQSELQEIFSSTSAQQRDTLVQAFSGSTITKRDLLTIRQVFLEHNSAAANNEAAMLDACVKTLEVLDKMGEITQEGLSFVPGVGWVTAATLSAARGGANAYRDGLGTKDIVKGVVISAGASTLVGRFSPLNADQAFNTARAGINVARSTVSQQVKTRAVALVKRAFARFGIKKTADYATEKGIGKAMETLADYVGAPNMAQQPNYVQDPSFDPMSSAPATPIAGGTPQL